MGVLFANGGIISIHTGMGNIFNNHSLHKNGRRCNKGQKMNERLKELAEQIWAEEYWANPNTDKLLPAQLNKFAELIVRECGEFCGHDHEGVVAMFKHFGVEE